MTNLFLGKNMAGYWEPPPLSFIETSEVPQHKGESMEFGAGTVEVDPTTSMYQFRC